MAWYIVWRKPHKKKYGFLKKSYRINGNMRTAEICIGPDEVATNILVDLAIRELIDETDMTYSGETISSIYPAFDIHLLNLLILEIVVL